MLVKHGPTGSSSVGAFTRAEILTLLDETIRVQGRGKEEMRGADGKKHRMDDRNIDSWAPKPMGFLLVSKKDAQPLGELPM